MIPNEQLIAYMAGTLAPAERAQMEDLIANDLDALRLLVDQERMDASLRVMFDVATERERVKQSILEVVSGSSYQDVKGGVLEAVAGKPPAFSWTEWLTGLRAVFAGGVAVAACLALALWLWLPRGATPAAGIAQLASVSEQVVVSRAGSEKPVTDGFSLQPGDTIRLGEQSRATVRYADDTRLELSAGAELTFAAAMDLDFASGTMLATVSKQPADRPMTIRTPHSVVTVVGTRFLLTVERRATRLEVGEGRVRLARVSDGHSVEVGGGQFAVAQAGVELRALAISERPVPPFVSVRGQELVARDPGYWPFTSASPWNHALGSGVKFVENTSPVLSFANGAIIHCVGNLFIFVAQPGDPLCRIVAEKKKQDEPLPPVRVPANAAADRPFARVVLIDENHRYAYEMMGFQRAENGDIATHGCLRIDLQSDGLPPAQRGAASSGVSSLAGLIRKGELTGGIRHALTCCVPQAALNRSTPDDPVFVWPAYVPTGHLWMRGLSETGNLKFGALLAIPPDVNLAQLGVGTSGPAYEIARALQDYGVYINGTFEENVIAPEKKLRLVFGAEQDAQPDVWKVAEADLAAVVRHLKVVSNNRPDSIGGGGVPRRPLAPGFAQGK